MRTENETGNRKNPIWLLGDSNPSRCSEALEVPLDPRHPSRHNIWTPICEEIQEFLYDNGHRRLDTRRLYIRNAVEDCHNRPSPASKEWRGNVESRVEDFQKLLIKYRPCLVLCFGAFAFEFARRTREGEEIRAQLYWNTIRLGQQFRKRVDAISPDDTTIVPLLHCCISRGHFITAHENFCGCKGANYFEHTGMLIARKLLEFADRLDVWVS